MEAGTTTGSWSDLLADRARAEVGEGLVQILALAGDTSLLSFAGGFPDPRTFPLERISVLIQELVASGDVGAFQYAPTRGLAGPLDALAHRLGQHQARRPADDELMVTSGAIEALELIGKSFVDPGDLVFVEGPTYLGAIMAFRSFEASVEAIPMDAAGLEVDELDRRLRGGARPKLLYVIPDHQNPAGVTLADDRRTTLVELARHYGFLLVEDVAYRELGFDDAPERSLWSVAPDVVVQAGTTSKTFIPGVRLGWAAGPAQVIHRLVAAKQNTDQCATPLGQRLLEEYIRKGWMDDQLQRSRSLYGSRCERLMAALDRAMPEGASWTRPRGGFFSWMTLPGSLAAVDFARRAVGRGVAVVPGVPFFPDGRGDHNLRLSYSRIEDEQIDDGVDRLAELIADMKEGVRDVGG